MVSASTDISVCFPLGITRGRSQRHIHPPSTQRDKGTHVYGCRVQRQTLEHVPLVQITVGEIEELLAHRLRAGRHSSHSRSRPQCGVPVTMQPPRLLPGYGQGQQQCVHQQQFEASARMPAPWVLSEGMCLRPLAIGWACAHRVAVASGDVEERLLVAIPDGQVPPVLHQHAKHLKVSPPHGPRHGSVIVRRLPASPLVSGRRNCDLGRAGGHPWVFDGKHDPQLHWRQTGKAAFPVCLLLSWEGSLPQEADWEGSQLPGGCE